MMARRAFDFIAHNMSKGDRLGHSWRDGKLLFPGLASDFAAMIRAALALYEATGERRYLDQALAWQSAFDTHYADPDTAGYYLSADDASDLLLRPHSTSDDATPNPNAVAAQNLVRLSVLAGNDTWRQKADQLIEGNSFRGRTQSVWPRGAAQCARSAFAWSRDCRDGPGNRALRASRTEAAVCGSYCAARQKLRRSASRASRARKTKSHTGERRFHLHCRALFIAGDESRCHCCDSGEYARILISQHNNYFHSTRLSRIPRPPTLSAKIFRRASRATLPAVGMTRGPVGSDISRCAYGLGFRSATLPMPNVTSEDVNHALALSDFSCSNASAL